MSRLETVRTGLSGLDKVFQYVRLGESVVWQISDLEDYAFFAEHFAEQGIKEGRKVIYFRFSDKPALLEEQEGLQIVKMDMDVGFEGFTIGVYNVMRRQDPGTYYVFDCMTDLQAVWAADFMVRNFFRAICPAIKEIKGVAYFSIIRGAHSYDSTRQISNAASILAHGLKGKRGMYVHPVKVVGRRTPNLFLPHLFSEDYSELIPITDGISTSKFYALMKKRSSRSAGRRFADNWENFFVEAEGAIDADEATQEKYKEKMYKMLIGRDPVREKLFRENFTVEDYLDINSRLIGSGTIGGKAAGMLLARKIITNNRPDLNAHLEEHDSYYIGSNVFYTYLIRNNWWKLWLEHKTDEGYFMAARALKSQMTYGEFPNLVIDKFKRMLNYFGQNPIIVRSSSLLEDGFGNAFAGKYDSVFCVNLGTPEQRLKQFIAAVKEVYVSSMDESALVYRKQRGLDRSEEQMSILVQRVSGSIFDDIFMPGAAGVGYSTNSYAWNSNIDPEAGMLRIVAGLGTRAVDRTFEDYPRIAALDRPDLLPQISPDDKFKFMQRNVDVLDFTDNMLLTIPIEEVAEKTPRWFSNLIIEHDRQTEARLEEKGRRQDVIATSCDKIMKNEEIVRTFREMMGTIRDHYHYPVDIEFTINFSEDGDFLINLVQCRPLQSKGSGVMNIKMPDVGEKDVFLRLDGRIMGGPVRKNIDMVAIVDAKGYAEMPYKDKFSVAAAVEAVNNYAGANGMNLMLMGPGRWGTSSAELGVPVRYAQICHVDALMEMSFESSGLMPELSFGSHFFQDLVEADTFYGAVFEADCFEGKASTFRPEIFADQKEIYAEIPDTLPALKDIITVYKITDGRLCLTADSRENAVCYLEK